MIRDPKELTALLEKSVAAFKAMSPAEQEAVLAEQRRGYAAAEMSWPAPKYKWVNGAKVYDSYEDYCND